MFAELTRNGPRVVGGKTLVAGVGTKIMVINRRLAPWRSHKRHNSGNIGLRPASACDPKPYSPQDFSLKLHPFAMTHDFLTMRQALRRSVVMSRCTLSVAVSSGDASNEQARMHSMGSVNREREFTGHLPERL